MNIKQLSLEAIQEINEQREQNLKTDVKSIVKAIVQEQEVIKNGEKRIKELKERLNKLSIELLPKDILE